MVPRLWPVLALPALVLGVAAAAETCDVKIPRQTRTYFTDEKVQMTLSLPEPRRQVSLRITDYYGQLCWRGAVAVGGQQPVALTVPFPLGPGYFRLELSWNAGSQQEVFCVLPRPYEDPGDYGIFGLCPSDGATEVNLEYASQMGVRLLRQTVPWPPVEPTRGVWRMELLENWYDLASRYGIQMMLILGYTPAFLAEKPLNTFDDVWANSAVFTWHPREPDEYWRYLDKVTGFAQGKTVRWPSAAVMPATGGLRPTPQSLPWAQSFEMWNEADICFYMGDWNRYLDLLRMSWASARQRLPGSLMVYGGSTGNFTAMGMTASGAGKYCFDMGALHTGGDVEDCLRVWYSGAQQIPWCIGAPRETYHTECYAQGRRGTVDYRAYRETPGELQRCYISLKAWREPAFFRSGCLGGFIGTKNDWAPGTAMVWSENGQLTPTPLYAAFAAARKLLSDAVEVGPVNLGDKVSAHLFLKHGTPMLAAWSDDGAMAAIRVQRDVKRIDPFGKETRGSGQSMYLARLGIEPLVLLGVDGAKYLPEALRRRFDLLTLTPYGTLQTNPACFVWYVHPMQQDLGDLLGSSAYTRLDSALRQAERALADNPARAADTLLAAQEVCWQTTQSLLYKCLVGQEIPVKTANNLWRLARLEEWLGEIADELSPPGPGVRAPRRGEVLWLNAWVEGVREGMATRHGDAQLPVAEHLLDRCRWQLWRLNQYQRQGTYNAILHKGYSAVRLNFIEQGVVLRAVPVVDFITGRSFRKARLFEPARKHTLAVSLYNYFDHAISGTLRLKLPAAWEPAETTFRFTAEPGAPAPPTLVEVTLADSPTPWVRTTTFTMDGLLNVSLPASLADNPVVEVSGTLDTGEPLCPMTYFVNVGRWLDEASTASAARQAHALETTAGNEGLQLPPGVKAMQTRSIMRQMEALNRVPRRTATAGVAD